MVLESALNSQPVAARGAFRVQTLHRRAGQILHRPSRLAKNVGRRREGKTDEPPSPPVKQSSKAPQKLAGLCAEATSVSRKMYPISWGTVAK